MTHPHLTSAVILAVIVMVRLMLRSQKRGQDSSDVVSWRDI